MTRDTRAARSARIQGRKPPESNQRSPRFASSYVREVLPPAFAAAVAVAPWIRTSITRAVRSSRRWSGLRSLLTFAITSAQLAAELRRLVCQSGDLGSAPARELRARLVAVSRS